MKLPKIVHRVIYALPVVSCLLFIVLFLKVKYTLYKLDTAIDRYNKSMRIADLFLSTSRQKYKSDSTIVVTSENLPLPNSPTDSSKDTLTRKPMGAIKPVRNPLPKKTVFVDNISPKKADTIARKTESNFADFVGLYEKEIVINRSDKFTKLNLTLRYRFLTDSNFKSIPPARGALNISETTKFGRKETHELTCKLSSVQIIGDQIRFVFKEPESYKSTDDINPINNKQQRLFILVASVNKNNISGILSWNDLNDDMMTYSDVKIPIMLSIE